MVKLRATIRWEYRNEISSRSKRTKVVCKSFGRKLCKKESGKRFFQFFFTEFEIFGRQRFWSAVDGSSKRLVSDIDRNTNLSKSKDQ